VLPKQLGWTRQRAARRSLERDDEKIDHWIKQRWPSIRHALCRGALIVFQDKSKAFLLPSVQATWAPEGCAPVISHHFGWK